VNATLEPAATTDWPGPRPPYAPAVVPRLDDAAVLRLEGRDARTFLTRQLTCDLAELAPGQVLPGAWLTPKGRVLALLALLAPRDTNGLIAVLPAGLARGVCQRLRLYVLRDDVRIEADDTLVAAGVLGAAVDTARAAVDAGAAGCEIARLPGDGARALLVGTPREVDAVIAACTAQGAAHVDANHWRLHQVAAGFPEVVPDIQDEFVPQMLNLDRVGAVSFTKGCYPGQEIVARTQHLGRIKRRMFRAVAPGAPLPAPGTAVTTASGAAVGRVVTAALAAHDTPHLLAVLSLDAVSTELHLGAGDGPPLQIVAPPYPLDG